MKPNNVETRGKCTLSPNQDERHPRKIVSHSWARFSLRVQRSTKTYIYLEPFYSLNHLKGTSHHITVWPQHHSLFSQPAILSKFGQSHQNIKYQETCSDRYSQSAWLSWLVVKAMEDVQIFSPNIILECTSLTIFHWSCTTLWWGTLLSWVHIREGEICKNICCGELTTADLTRHWWRWPTLRGEVLENQGWVLGSRRHQRFSSWNRSGTKPDQELPCFEITWSLFANGRVNLFDLRIKIFNQIVKFSDFPPQILQIIAWMVCGTW